MHEAKYHLHPDAKARHRMLAQFLRQADKDTTTVVATEHSAASQPASSPSTKRPSKE